MLFLLLCLGTLAIVYKESRITLEKIKDYMAEIDCKQERVLTQKFLRSYVAIKMKFGANNFVEDLTPLNCLSHSLQISVQLLLLQRKS